MTRFKEALTTKGDDIIYIDAEIYVDRKTQKAIIIGHQGQAIKQMGTEARKDMEDFLQSKVHLDLRVKVKEGWRNNDKELKRFGY